MLSALVACPTVGPEALSRIAALYEIERHIAGQSADARKAARAKARPIIGALEIWLTQQLGRIPSGGALADAIRYALARWQALCRFLSCNPMRQSGRRLSQMIRFRLCFRR